MKTKKLTLTIVIPAYNEERYLDACLRSIKSQSRPADEVIVVDNNSTDGTAKLAAGYKFVTLLKEPKQGAIFARNLGFNSASSDIIARIDADSILPAGWVKEVVASFSNEAIAAVTGPARGYDLPLPSMNWLPHHLLCLILSTLPPKRPFLFGFNMAIRRTAWRKVRGRSCRDRYIHEDLDLAIHLHQAGQKPGYSGRLLLGASGRRYSDHLKSFHFYMKTYVRTYRRHNINDWSIYFAVAIYYLGYIFYRPWTLRRRPRKNPMGI